MTYCPTKMQYRKRWYVSLLCSEREEVVPYRSNHQKISTFEVLFENSSSISEEIVHLALRRDKLVLNKNLHSTISTGKLNTLLCFYCQPINLVVYQGSFRSCDQTRSYLGGGFPLRCFQRLSVGNLATRQCSFRETTDTPGIPSTQSSRTRVESPQISHGYTGQRPNWLTPF